MQVKEGREERRAEVVTVIDIYQSITVLANIVQTEFIASAYPSLKKQ